MEVLHERCSKCKCWRLPAEFLNPKGRKLKTCGNCRALSKIARERLKCEHKRQKNKCKDCGGSAICEHNRRKSRCKDCGGASICEHKRLKSQCKICDPNGHLKHSVSVSKLRIDWTDQERKPAMECLGCDIETYRTYLTNLFKPGMNWENYGDWEIDHIIPLKFENPTFEQAFKRLHYTNTQPLWKSENRSKGNKLTV